MEYIVNKSILVECKAGRLDKFLYGALQDVKNVTHGSIARWIHEGRVKVNERPTTSRFKLSAGDVVELIVPQLGVDSKLKVVYEDDYLMAVDKPANLSSHGTLGDFSPNLTHLITSYFPDCGNLPRSGIVNRLDKDTTGLMLVAKSERVLQALQDMMRKREVDRSYIALVHGTFRRRVGCVKTRLKRDHRLRGMKVSVDSSDREAVTHYEVLDSFLDASLVKCTLGTGRTHQIRVHMSYLKHPVMGDKKYSRYSCKRPVKRQALHAYRLSFVHPFNGSHLHVTADIPDDILKLVSAIKGDIYDFSYLAEEGKSTKGST